MCRALLAVIAIVLAAPCAAAPDAPAPAPATERQFQMDHYWLALITKGPAWTAERTDETAKLQEGHMANIRSMAAAGKLLIAGPMEDNGDLRGIFIFKVESKEEAEALIAKDPAVAAKRLTVELHPWFAAKGLTYVQSQADLERAASAAGLPWPPAAEAPSK
jgi:uncharacterized protein YciI